MIMKLYILNTLFNPPFAIYVTIATVQLLQKLTLLKGNTNLRIVEDSRRNGNLPDW